MNKHVMLVEDDAVVRDNYVELLGDEGFVVDGYACQHTALESATETLPDLALLDISLDDERDAGFRLCAELRKLSKRLPIMFFTSHDDESDRISGIRLGADDYVTKDVSVRYLAIRMEALLRRCAELSEPGGATGSDIVGRRVVGPLSIDLDRLHVSWRDRKVDLSLGQIRMVAALVERQGKVVSFSALMRAAEICVEPNTITAHIRAIRSAFGEIDPRFALIESVRGVGYRWLAE